MKLRTTIILVVIAVGLGLFIYILDRRNPSQRARETSSSYLVNINRRAVEHLLIQNGETTVELRRAGDGWAMQQPLQDRADAAVIGQLLSDLESLRPEDALLDLGHGERKKQKLRDFGLLKPRLRLQCDGSGRRWDLSFGNNTAVEGSGYVRVQGKDPVYVVANTTKDILTRKPDDFRDHRLTPFLTTQIDRIELHLNGGLIALHKTQDNWEMDRPIKARASNERVANLLTKVNGSTIQDFVDLNGQALGEMGGQTTALVLGAGDEQVGLTFGGARLPHQRLLAISDRPKAFLVDEAVWQALDVHPNDLRDRKVARFNLDLIDRVTISAGQQAFTLGRKEDRWVFADDHQAANPDAVSQLFQKLTTQDVDAFVSDAATDLARYGLEQPQRTITFSSYASENTAESNAGETSICTLLLGKSENGVTYARLAEEPYVFSISDAALANWPTTREEFRSLDLLQFHRGDLTEVIIEKPGQPPIRLSRGAKGHWEKDQRADPAEDPKIQTFLNTLVTLRAQSWAASTIPENFPTVLTIVNRLHRNSPGESLVTLRLGPPEDGGVHRGTVSNLSGTFRLGPGEFAELDHGLGPQP